MSLKTLLQEYEQLPEFQGVALKSVNQQGGFRSTPLHIAVYRERLDEVRLLLQAKADPNASGEYGEPPLQVALVCGNRGIVEQLVRAGANCGLTDDKGMNSWQVADAFGFREELMRIVRGTAPSQPAQE